MNDDGGSGLNIDDFDGPTFNNSSEDSFSLSWLILRNNLDLLGCCSLGLNDLSGLSHIDLILGVDFFDNIGDFWDDLDDIFG